MHQQGQGSGIPFYRGYQQGDDSDAADPSGSSLDFSGQQRPTRGPQPSARGGGGRGAPGTFMMGPPLYPPQPSPAVQPEFVVNKDLEVFNR